MNNKNHLEALHQFSESTKQIRNELSQQLNKRLHRRVEVECEYSEKNKCTFEFKIYEFNNLDSYYIGSKYIPGLSVGHYLDTIAALYNDPAEREQRMMFGELEPSEKLFITWLEATGMSEHYALSPEGVILTELPYSIYDGEIFIQDFTATYSNKEKICKLESDESGSYILSETSITKIA